MPSELLYKILNKPLNFCDRTYQREHFDRQSHINNIKGETADFKTSKDFTRLQAQRLQIFRRLLKTSGDFKRLQWDFETSGDFIRLQETSRDFRRPHETSRDSKRLQETLGDFNRLRDCRSV